ncbi:YjgN family protein [Marinobacter halotolerans]|uniref:YjgN family protein n=1 Tax=Marinobacter halotolerans TaxID=1569211 RepID=UPI001245D090|nr:YjgN family protein [Marinobacter halotolerans]
MTSENERTTYQIIFDGRPLPEFDIDAVKTGVQSLFQLSDTRAAHLFSGAPKILKSGLTHQQALDYQQRLASIGAFTELAATPPAEPDPVSLADDSPFEASTEYSTTAEPPAMTAQEPPISEVNDDSGDIRQAGFQFTGSGREYFGIWIVNILLTIVTLGIYSAWATVRNNQYFYGNTQLDDSSFQYLAKPLTILKGRLIALAVLVLFVALSELYVEAAIILAIAFIPLTPWIMVKSLRFRAVNSAYRNVRFDFQGSYGQALMVSFVWPLLNVFTLMLLTPLVMKRTHEFIANGSRYGTSEFALNASIGDYYRFFGKAVLIAAAFGVVSYLATRSGSAGLGMAIGLIGYLALLGYFIAGIANLFFSSVQLADHGFDSELQPVQMVWIYLSNSFLVAITLGLYTPWAKCRMARYRASRTSMLIAGDLQRFTAAEETRTSALGQELGDAFDVDFAAI